MTGRNGHLYIISAPSGAGKTTLCRALLDRFPDIRYSVSYTTRKPRKGEQEGVDYHFIAQDDFVKRLQAGKWAEWAKVYDHFYGTSADILDRQLEAGQDMLLDIDVQGTLQILQRYPQSITIFVMPPSLDTLRRRLESRKSDSLAEMAKRLSAAEKEMQQKDLYRHVIVNDRLPAAVAELISLVEKYRGNRRQNVQVI